MATDTSHDSGKRSEIGNFLKAILLVALAIVLLRVMVGVLHWLFGIVVTLVVVLVLGMFIFGVIRSFKK